MATGTIVKAWKDAVNAYASVSVDDGPPRGVVEYLASTPLLDDAGSAKTTAQLKSELAANVSAERNAQLATTAPVAVSGTVTV